MSMRRICRVCTAVSLDGTPFCRAHTPDRKQRFDYDPIYKRERKKLFDTITDDTRCSLCGELRKSGDPWTAEHVVPRSLGGGHTHLEIAHRSCNSKKGNRRKKGAGMKGKFGTYGA